MIFVIDYVGLSTYVLGSYLMRFSQFPFPLAKSTPRELELVSHSLMLRCRMVDRLASGIYTWLPFGLRVLKKVERIVRQEMNRIGGAEILMPVLQPKEIWEKSNRWNQYGDELFRLTDRHERDFCLGPTHEEVITSLAKGNLSSYRSLPAFLYQIQVKFRDEIRPRFGVMRSREFIMKDGYSFHSSEGDLREFYSKILDAYKAIFKALEVKFRIVAADSGLIGGKESHEFQIIADSGETEIAYFEEDEELSGYDPKLISPSLMRSLEEKMGTSILTARGIEVGHTFKLGTKYSQQLDLFFRDQNDKDQSVEMGCYGIGIARLPAAVIEQRHDDLGIDWPTALAPFKVALIPIGYHRDVKIREKSNQIFQMLREHDEDILLCDQEATPGEIFSSVDLLGIPYKFILSKSLLDRDLLEIKERKKNSLKEISLDFNQIFQFYKDLN